MSRAIKDRPGYRYCPFCKTTRREEDFYKSKKDDHIKWSYWCRVCNKVEQKKYYRSDKEKYKKAIRANIDKKREYYNELWKKNNNKSPMKRHARMRVNNAVIGGYFAKLPCEVCGATKVDFHHTNGYEEENVFIGKWLCRQHHKDEHMRLKLLENK